MDDRELDARLTRIEQGIALIIKDLEELDEEDPSIANGDDEEEEDLEEEIEKETKPKSKRKYGIKKKNDAEY